MSSIQPQVNNIIAAHAAGRGQAICQADFNLINAWRWNPNITTAIDQFLTVSGWNVMKSLAQPSEEFVC
ncbi:CLUMA_CG004197, isoform A [Clunio marinus]|uniref:CLUMA_CG004197, isoform A n=1 Tax=Clunio marinus TaxID=568069 RepID=A0A1J1HR24_9DIPT|nr:CLUMA_CG004197, isoform A [Clunio marinus]